MITKKEYSDLLRREVPLNLPIEDLLREEDLIDAIKSKIEATFRRTIARLEKDNAGAYVLAFGLPQVVDIKLVTDGISRTKGVASVVKKVLHVRSTATIWVVHDAPLV